MTSRGRGFVLFSLLWLPAGLVAVSVVRGMPITLLEPQAWLSLAMISPCGLPLALAWKKIQCVGYPAVAWMVFAVLAPATAASSLFAGLLGPVAIVQSMPWASVRRPGAFIRSCVGRTRVAVEHDVSYDTDRHGSSFSGNQNVSTSSPIVGL